MKVHVREFQALVAVVNRGSFTGAAKDMGTAQSNVSASVRSLEKRSQRRMLVRRYRKVIPTEDGERLYNLVKPAIDTLISVARELEGPHRP